MFGEAFDIHLLSAFDLHQMADSSGAAHQDSDFFLSPVDVSAKPHRWRLFPDVIPSQELTTSVCDPIHVPRVRYDIPWRFSSIDSLV